MSPSAAPNKGIRTIPPIIVTGAILYFMVGTILLLMGASKWPYAPKLATSRSTHENGTPSYKVIGLNYNVHTQSIQCTKSIQTIVGGIESPCTTELIRPIKTIWKSILVPQSHGKNHMDIDFSFQVTYVLNRHPRGRGNDQRELGGDPGRI